MSTTYTVRSYKGATYITRDARSCGGAMVRHWYKVAHVFRGALAEGDTGVECSTPGEYGFGATRVYAGVLSVRHEILGGAK